MERNPEHETRCCRSTLWCVVPHRCRAHFEVVTTPDDLETGDLIFYETEALGGSLTRVCTGIRWDHVGMIVHSSSGSYTLECVADGIQFYHLHQRLNDVVVRRLAVRRLRFPEISRTMSPLQRLIATEPQLNAEGIRQWPEIMTREYVIRRISEFVSYTRGLRYVAPLKTWCWLACCVGPTVPVLDKVQIRLGHKPQPHQDMNESHHTMPTSKYFGPLHRSAKDEACVNSPSFAPVTTTDHAISSFDISIATTPPLGEENPAHAQPSKLSAIDLDCKGPRVDFPGTVPMGQDELAEVTAASSITTAAAAAYKELNLYDAPVQDNEAKQNQVHNPPIISTANLETAAGRSQVRKVSNATRSTQSHSAAGSTTSNEIIHGLDPPQHILASEMGVEAQPIQKNEILFEQLSNMIKRDEDGALYCSSYIAACYMYAGLFTLHPHTTYYMPFDLIHESSQHLPWRLGSGVNLGEVQVIPKHRMGCCSGCCTNSQPDTSQSQPKQ